MTTPTKQRIKAFVIEWEMRWYGLTASLFLGAIIGLYIGAPTISNTTLAAIQLFSGLTATIAGVASAIKSNDTTE